MSWLEENLPWVILAAVVGIGGLLLWLSHRADAEECEETGMHSVCQDWVNINGGMVCLRSKKEPCEP